MSMKIIAVNAGPRKGWNTDTLIEKAMEGAREAGAEVEKFDLFRLEKYTGCISCFGCKKEKFKGHCIVRELYKNSRSQAAGVLYCSGMSFHTLWCGWKNQSAISSASAASAASLSALRADLIVTVVSAKVRSLEPSSMPFIYFAAAGAQEPFSTNAIFLFW